MTHSPSHLSAIDCDTLGPAHHLPSVSSGEASDSLLGKLAERLQSILPAPSCVVTRWALAPAIRPTGGATPTMEVIICLAASASDPVEKMLQYTLFSQRVIPNILPFNLAFRVLFSESNRGDQRVLGICELDAARLDHSILS